MKFEILLVTDAGCEEAAAQELQRWVKTPVQKHLQLVSTIATLEEAALLGYWLQVPRRILIRLAPTISSLDDLASHTIDKALLGELMAANETFKAEADVCANSLEGTAENLPMTQEVAETVGGWFHRAGYAVKLSAPDRLVYALVTSEGVTVGLDVVGLPLAKREWRIMLSRRSLKATIAAAAAIYSGVTAKQRILDPLGDDGTLTIELTMLLAHVSPRKFAKRLAFEKFPGLATIDWKTWRKEQDAKVAHIVEPLCYSTTLQEMKAVRTNSKLAGVEKLCMSTKVGVDWVDTKIDEGEVSAIITMPYTSGKAIPPARTEQHLKDLFYQSEYILKKNATMTCVTEKPQEVIPVAQRYGFILQHQHDVLMGLRRMAICTFKNTKKEVAK